MRSVSGKRIVGAEVSAERIATLLDHGVVAEIYAASVGIPAKDVRVVRFTRNGMIFDEIEFDVTPAGRAGPDRFVELFNQAVREGYRR